MFIMYTYIYIYHLNVILYTNVHVIPIYYGNIIFKCDDI
jgi:hypothetical protein